MFEIRNACKIPSRLRRALDGCFTGNEEALKERACTLKPSRAFERQNVEFELLHLTLTNTHNPSLRTLQKHSPYHSISYHTHPNTQTIITTTTPNTTTLVHLLPLLVAAAVLGPHVALAFATTSGLRVPVPIPESAVVEESEDPLYRYVLWNSLTREISRDIATAARLLCFPRVHVSMCIDSSLNPAMNTIIALWEHPFRSNEMVVCNRKYELAAISIPLVCQSYYRLTDAVLDDKADLYAPLPSLFPLPPQKEKKRKNKQAPTITNHHKDTHTYLSALPKTS